MISLADKSRRGLFLPEMKKIFFFSAEAGREVGQGKQRLTFSEAEGTVPPNSEDNFFCTRCPLGILTQSPPLHSTLTFQDLEFFYFIHSDKVPHCYKIRCSLESRAFSLSGAPRDQDTAMPRGGACLCLLKESGRSHIRPQPPNGMTWMEITNRNST